MSDSPLPTHAPPRPLTPLPLPRPLPAAAPAPAADHDLALVARVGGDDVAAFEAIVLTYARPLTAYAWRYLKSADAAADVAQDVFAHLWEHRAQLHVRGTLRGYLYAATRNRALNVLEHHRIEARWREGARATAAHLGVAALAVPPSALPDAILERSELGATVQDALRSLPPRAREIARLRWIERLSQREIAQVLGIAVPTVSVHLTRTAKRLRALLAGVWP